MLGFKLSFGPVEAGGLLVDSTSMSPWGATLMEVLEVLDGGEHLPRPYHSPAGLYVPEDARQLEGPPNYRVRCYRATGTLVKEIVGWAHIKSPQCTRDEYLKVWNTRRMNRPRWKKNEWKLYSLYKERGESRKEAVDRVNAIARNRVYGSFDELNSVSYPHPIPSYDDDLGEDYFPEDSETQKGGD